MSMELLSGNQAIVKGALKAQLSFFSGYPITPASEIMSAIVKEPIEFIQAEDELAAINMAIGASLAGKKAMTATSGPGLSLMQESIGFAYKIGAPLLIVDCQRVGPSTGMPTLGAQGDVLPARYGSHGDSRRLIFTPNSVSECYRFAIEAINAAEESLSPVVLLVDGILAHLYETVNLGEIDRPSLKKRKFKKLGEGKRHYTGLTSKNNLPETKDAQNYRNWYRQRKQKILKTAKKYSFFQYFENKKASTLLVAYGIVSRVIFPLKEKYAIFRPIRLFPVIDKLKEIASEFERVVVIEMNDGQYKKELETFLARKVDLITQLGGKLSAKEIKNELSKIS